MIIQSKNVKALLHATTKPVHIGYLSYDSEPLQSSVLLAATNGAILSFVTSKPSTPSETHSLNNLKMMSLLIRDKWNEDEQQELLRARYDYTITVHEEPTTTHIYTYEIEDLHACVAQIPQSDLLLLFIADSNFAYGLLVMKIKGALEAFRDMYGYKLE
ncbi:related to SLM4-Protein with putative role in actin cytoskeleton organization [Zygosaccharomyces bailii ISA1307]|uniref:ZYBA0S12-02168g1_1 n=1 Tax=Zygosaccharomyces bailii (strain CLIB 213 / ATCC 58445 / CBS 680 / BCRC 21525 / NBRC 1098 / NCYC 1416 / NRRL Y-2227) TaxID=1333698 RepID=A0A8J2TAV0_ZYGB2|nr:ZYBA0S12-02168g1_1 [Zygosaccharomyces bailii CLIB 213]CDH11059.1 related to SLM4-Protein with putative role in actin cytoskeleton organization [Zygosaccharomyces bailii ISA1307]